MERPNGGFGRGYGRDNNMRAQQQAPIDRPQLARQEDEWSLPPNVERRDDTERQQTTQTSPPAVPPPTEERLFTDWSSEGSPRERVNQQIQSARSVESRRTINQTEQSVREPGDDEVLRYVLSDVTTTPSARIQISQVGARFIDRETNTSEVEIRPPREEVRSDIIHAHSKGIQVPSSSSELSSHNMNIDDSIIRPRIPIIMPQLDGPTSVCVRRKQPVPMVRRRLQYLEKDILMRVIVTLMTIDHMRIEGILEEEDITRKEVEDHQIEKITRVEDIQEEGDPLMMEDPQMMEDPLMVEDPLMMEDPQEMEDHQEDLEDKDHQAHQDLLDQCAQ